MNVAGMSGIPGAQSLRRTKLATARQETMPIGMTVTNLGPIQMVDIKCQTCVVAGLRAMRSTGERSDTKPIPLLGQGFDGPQHLRVQFHVSDRSSPVGTSACHLTSCRLFDIVACRGAIVSTAWLTGHPVDVGAPP